MRKFVAQLAVLLTVGAAIVGLSGFALSHRLRSVHSAVTVADGTSVTSVRTRAGLLSGEGLSILVSCTTIVRIVVSHEMEGERAPEVDTLVGVGIFPCPRWQRADSILNRLSRDP